MVPQDTRIEVKRNLKDKGKFCPSEQLLLRGVRRWPGFWRETFVVREEHNYHRRAECESITLGMSKWRENLRKRERHPSGNS